MNRIPTKSPGLNHRGGGRRGNLLIVVVAAAMAVFGIVAYVLLAGFPFGASKPNIILISIDTLRHDRLGIMGHRPNGRSPSEFIDRLAEEGAVFSSLNSTSSWTLPGHYAMMTGLPGMPYRAW